MKILLSKELPDKDKILSSGIVSSLNQVELLKTAGLPVEHIPQADYVVITSVNSLESILPHLSELPPVLFCVGQKTGDKLQEYGYRGTTHSFNRINLLCQALVSRKPGTILYLCGTEHRNNLDQFSIENPGFQLIKKYCYKSIQTFPKLPHCDFDLVSIYSPRAAESLFFHNSFPENTTFMCIGPVTAEAVTGKGYSRVFYPQDPSNSSVQQLIINYINASKRLIS